MKEKDYFMILDVETAGGFACPLPYDIGFIICDRKGIEYYRESFVIQDIFYNNKLMNTAYYKEKKPLYIEQIAQGKRKVASAKNICYVMNYLIDHFHVTKIGAYNANFDINALNCLAQKVLKKDTWFEKELEIFCIWHMATQTILQQKTFFKQAEKEGWISDKGNIKTSAEIAYRYITKKMNFEESHTGLEDVEIEKEIFLKVLNQHKKMVWSPKNSCWTIANKEYKNWKKGA